AIAGVGEPEPLEHLRGGRPGLPTAEAEEAGDHVQVFLSCHGRLDRRGLAREADDLADAPGFRDRVGACDPPLSRVRPQESGHRADEGRLPGAVRSEEGGDAPRFGDDVEAVESLDVAEALREAVRLDDGGHWVLLRDDHRSLFDSRTMFYTYWYGDRVKG